jgi:hypothetical protein
MCFHTHRKLVIGEELHVDQRTQTVLAMIQFLIIGETERKSSIS